MLSIRELTRQLHSLGVRIGDVVMVHASLRAIGPVEGRALGLLDAVRGAIGPQGTLLMVLSALEGEPFDALRTPVDTADYGILAEVFRTFPGVQVSDHAADRFAALGAVRSGAVGNSTAELFDAQAFVVFATQWIEKHLQ
jgi:aminoglycoside 3-N-acetyltransferase